MAYFIENPHGRRMVRLSVDDILTVVAMYQQMCNCKNLSYDEVRQKLTKNQIYLPEDV